MDTANDPRLAVAEQALEDLKDTLKHGHIKAQIPQGEARQTVEKALGSLKAIKYAYAEPEALVQMKPFQELIQANEHVEDLLGGPSFHEEIDEKPRAVASARWTIDTIRSLERRLRLPGDEPELAVDVRKGRIVTVTDHPSADELVVTRVAAGRGLTVVTNDQTVAQDDDVGVALLAPTDLRGVISEGMFLGAEDGVLTDVEEGDDGRPDVPEAAYHETRNMITAFLDD